MQGLRRCSDDIVRLDLTSLSSPSSSGGGGGGGGPQPPPPSSSSSSMLSIDVAESAEARIRRLISEHPVIIFSRSSCCMCHVMKKLLATIGVHPTVIELDDHEIAALPSDDSDSGSPQPRNPAAPSVFIGGTCIGGLESLVALHLSGQLVTKLVQVGALWV
ncbi:glutaredoxin-C6 [Quercus lobata]|uniref:Glutaredoxin domain-containing protein n=1 Tax=Quercus lobata TaxID=97700 RepID=A0A7N2KRJ0_QUELO|nr:glutaredoxin-C6 [Quercus lobata]